MTAAILTCLSAGDDPSYFSQYLDDIYANRRSLENVIIIVDGPIPVELHNILELICEDPLFCIIKLTENQGLINGLNLGLAKCHCKYCIRLDPDDRMSRDRVAKLLQKFRSSNADVVFNAVKIIDDDGIIVKTDLPDENLIYKRNPYYHSGSAYKTDVIRKIGGYREFKSFEDYDLWLRVKRAGLNIQVIPETISSFRFSTQTVDRRRGLKYFWREFLFAKSAFSEGNLKLKYLPFWILRLLTRLLPRYIILQLRLLYFNRKNF